MATFKSRTKTEGKTTTKFRSRINPQAYSSLVYSNQNAYNALNDYAKRINKGEWLSAEDRAAYKSAIDTYTSSGNKLREVGKRYGATYTPEDERNWLDSIGALNSGYTGINDFYNQFANDREYGAYKTRQDQYAQYNSPLGSEQYKANSGYVSGTNNPYYEYINGHGGKAFQGVFQAPGNLLNYVGLGQTTNAYREADQKGYGEMTEDEIGLYNYYYKTGGKEKAEEYLNFITDDLVRRKAGQEYEEMKGKSDLEKVFYGFVAGMESGVAGIENIGALITGGQSFTPSASYVSANLRNDLAGSNGQLTAGQVMYDLANTTGNMLPSIMVGTMTSGLGGALTMGVSSAGNSYNDLLAQGYTPEQAAAYGVVSGIKEAGMSYLLGGISKLGGKLTNNVISKLTSGVGNAIGRLAIKVGGNMLSEGFEEALQEALDPVIKMAVTGEDFEGIDIENVLYSGMLGALSGGMLEGVPNIVGTSVNAGLAKAQYGSKPSAVVSTALDINPNSKVAQKASKRIAAGKNVSAFSTLSMLENIYSGIAESDTVKIKEAVVNRLTELGEKGNISKIADVLAKDVMGESLTEADYQVLNKSSKGYLVATELNESNVKSGNLASKWAESIGTRQIGDGLYNKSANTAVKTSDGAQTAIAKVVNAGDGEVTVELADGTQTEAKNIAFNDEKAELVFKTATERVGRVEGWTTETANAMIKAYEDASDMTPESFAKGWTEAYDLGKVKGAQSQLSVMPYARNLPEGVRTRAYSIGSALSEAKIVKNTNKGSFTFEDSVTPEMQREFTKKQQNDVKALKIISEALGINVRVFDSPVNAEGKRVGENGSYDAKTRTLRVDLHAGRDGEGLVAFTAAHELTHHMRAYAKDSFNSFANAVFKSLGEGGVNVQELVEARVDSLRKGGRLKGLNESQAYDLAYEEVVSDAAERMLTDSDALARLSDELKSKDKNLWQRVKDYIASLVKKIKDAYAKLNPDSVEANLLKQVSTNYDDILKIWSEGLVKMSREETVSVGENSEYNKENETKYSDRDSLGNELSEEQAEFFKDSKVRDKKGNLMVLYHGTTANFNTFKKGDVGFHFGTKGAARGRVGFGKNVTLKEVYLNITNPIVFDEDLGSWDADYRLTEELYDKGILTQAEAEAVLLSDDKSYRRTTEAANKKLASLLVAKGYDGIAYSNTFETKKATTSYIVFNSNQAKEITNKAPTASADIRYSERDTTYLDAVNRGDMETAQRMVDEAAKEAGYTVKAYHGTKATFTVFDKSKIRSGATLWASQGDGFYFTENKDVANKYSKVGKVVDAFLKMENAFVFVDKKNNTANKLLKEFAQQNGRDFDINEYSDFVDFDKRTGTVLSRVVVGDGEAFTKFLQAKKYDGIVYNSFNYDTNKSDKTYVVFSSEQIKSADPVTYDDKGNVIPLSERFNPGNSDIRYSDRTDDSMSNRSLLANALDSVAQSPMEKQKLAEYKAKIRELNVQSRKLYEINQEIKELTFGKGKKNPERLKALREEATKTTNRINLYDKKLLDLEATKPLRDVLERETKKAYKAAAQKGREALHRNVEGRHKTEERHKIQRIAKELDALLNRGTKDKNVKKGASPLVRAALDVSDMLFATDDELIVNGVGTEYTTAEAAAMDEYVRLYEEYHSYDNSVTEHKERRAFLRSQMTDLKHSFEGVIERERQRINDTQAATMYDVLIKEYKKLEKAEEGYLKNAYDKDAAAHLEALKEKLGKTVVGDMTLEQLKDLYKAFKMVKTLVSNSNTLFRNGKRESYEARRDRIFLELGKHKSLQSKDLPEAIADALNKLNEFGWRNLRPIDVFEILESEGLTELYWDVIDAQSVYAKDIEEVKSAIIKARQSHGYKKWDVSKIKSFKMPDGRQFTVTLGEMMSIYAYSKREQADAHMREGGFQHERRSVYKDGKVKKLRKNEMLTYKVGDSLRLEIFNSLTKEQRAYVDEVQKLLTDWGEKGNEASRMLYGIDLFTEKMYFPLKSSHDYLSSVQTEIGKTATTASLAGIGMAKQTVPGADNPIILQAFDDVVLEHFDSMSKYHAYLVPIDNLRKVLDAQGKSSSDDVVSVKALIGAKFGDGARDYLQTYITDLNGSAKTSGAKNPIEDLFGKSKAMAVAANLSVWIQQYFSVIRVFSDANPKYFIPFMGEQHTKGDMKAYDEMKKYAPITTIKEMGGFDVGSHRTIKDYIGYEESGVTKDLVAKTAQDIFGIGASFMDKLGWTTIWKGVKKEVAASGNYKVGSEEYYKACGKRFEELIVKTQVYDSVNARSEHMRSKDGAMKYLVSFMGEPTTIAGMAEVSTIKLVRALGSKDADTIKKVGGKFVATMSALALSAAMTDIAKAIIFANRDDDEDETYLEKYAQALGSAFKDDVNLLNYFPVARDIVSIIEGRTIERPDMSIVADLIDSFLDLCDSLGDEDATVEDKIYDGIDTAGAIGNLFGIPIKNIWRDIKGLVNSIIARSRGYNSNAAKSFVEGWTGKEAKKGEKLYNSIVNGDTKRVDYYKTTYKDDSTYLSAVRKALRENDPRMREAAEAYINKDYATYNAIRDEIVKEGVFERSLVTDALKAEINYLKEKNEGK